MKTHEKHPALIVREEDPLNAGPPPERLGQAFVTPNELLFVRNHGRIPQVDPDQFRLSVDGLARRPLSISLHELRTNYPKTTLTATLQCAGNRRKELIAVRPIPGELEWDIEAIGNTVWSGVALRDVLRTAGSASDARHVAFLGLDEVEKGGRTSGFGGSVPIEKALSPEVLLAYEMNGEPLPPAHGFPLRVIVPGYIGARSVKWLGSITLQAEPSTNYFQTHAYKVFPLHISAENVDWTTGLTLGELPVNSVILHPKEGDARSPGHVTIRGYAMSGGRRIERIEVSADGGEHWATATQSEERSPWTWCLWEIALKLSEGLHQIVVRAWDSSAQTQPEDLRKIWNFKGYLNNAWHRVNIVVVR